MAALLVSYPFSPSPILHLFILNLTFAQILSTDIQNYCALCDALRDVRDAQRTIIDTAIHAVSHRAQLNGW